MRTNLTPNPFHRNPDLRRGRCSVVRKFFGGHLRSDRVVARAKRLAQLFHRQGRLCHWNMKVGRRHGEQIQFFILRAWREEAVSFRILGIELEAEAGRQTTSLSSGLSLTENVVCSTIIRPAIG